MIERYSINERGDIVFIGNTLGLSKLANRRKAGVLGSIGAFTCLDVNSKVSDFPYGTTLDYSKNGATAWLDIPKGSEVLYAELIWSGIYKAFPYDVSAKINSAVKFTTPDGEHYVVGDNLTKFEGRLNAFIPSYFYIRTQNVTDLLTNNVSGKYSVERVPSIIHAYNNSSNFAGWTLMVAYKNESLSLRHIKCYSLHDMVTSNSPKLTLTIDDIATPDVLDLHGKLCLSAIEGDVSNTGVQVYFGRGVNNMDRLSTPNNPADNFFASQVNDNSGNLDTKGTFGYRNGNPWTGEVPMASRTGYDITGVDVSSTLVVNQKQAVIEFLTVDDTFIMNGLGLIIDSNSPRIVTKLFAETSYVNLNENIPYMITVSNDGLLTANDVCVEEFLPEYTTIVSGSITVDGVSISDTFVIELGVLPVMKEYTIRFLAKAEYVPHNNVYVNRALVKYDYEPLSGHLLNGTAKSNIQKVANLDVDILSIKTVDKAYAIGGEVITYTNTITNTGSSELTGIIFQDILPVQVEFIAGSVTINNLPLLNDNPIIGFALPDLSHDDVITVAFKIIVK